MTAAPSRSVVTWREVLAETAEQLGNETEARWLVEEVSGYSWAELSAASAAGGPVSERSRSRLEAMLRRRLAGEPVQYVLGRWQFRTLDLMVDERVLIPRPETEYVAELALRELDNLAGTRAGQPQTVVDLGTGSGAIALSIAVERARVHVFATDASPAALRVAAANLAGLGGRPATRVRLMPGDWWSALPADLRGRLDLAVSNPPYIASAEMASLDPAVRDWEPGGALESGPTGLEAVREVLLGAANGWLRTGGSAVVEIAPHQASEAARLAARAGFAEAEVHPDLAGRDRVLIARGAP